MLIGGFDMNSLRLRAENSVGSGSAVAEILEELLHLFRELTASLKLPAFGSDSSLEETLEVLRHRSPYFVAVNGRPMVTLNDEDDEFLYSFGRIVQRLDAVMEANKDWWSSPDTLTTAKQIRELNAVFASSKAAIGSISRHIQVNILLVGDSILLPMK